MDPAAPPTAPAHGWGIRLPRFSAVALTFGAIAALMVVMRLAGLRLNDDVDDLLKLQEIRHLLATGDIFDRTLPGIRQPEPYVTHWPWIVDLPYAVMAALLTPLIGAGIALKTACFVVPLLLLAPALFAYNRIVTALGFAAPAAALPLAALFAMRALFEFAPGRIDYHNLQILLCLTALALLLASSRAAAFVNGMLAALALVISLEFAAFYALIVAILGFEFVFGRKQGALRLCLFGSGLACAAVALFAAVIPPSAYLATRCDTYSLPQGMALALGGLSMAIVPLLSLRRGGRVGRATMLAGLGALTCILLAWLFPTCLGGPYGALSDYVRENHLARINQEKSLFARPDFVLSSSFVSMAVLFVGALATAVLCIADRARSRALVIVSLFSALSLALAIAYFRYFRYLPIFSGIGLVFVLGAFMPPVIRPAAYVRSRFDAMVPRLALVLPGLLLAGVLGLYHLVWRASPDRIPAAEFADSCDLAPLARQSGWPPHARIMAPPNIGIQLLALGDGPAVVAIPHHPSWRGIERAYRFLDPATADPRALLDASGATHVAVCAWRGTSLPGLAGRYPLAAALMEGRPPDWLSECPTSALSPIRIYGYRKQDGSLPHCPLPAEPDQGTTISMR